MKQYPLVIALLAALHSVVAQPLKACEHCKSQRQSSSSCQSCDGVGLLNAVDLLAARMHSAAKQPAEDLKHLAQLPRQLLLRDKKSSGSCDHHQPGCGCEQHAPSCGCETAASCGCGHGHVQAHQPTRHPSATRHAPIMESHGAPPMTPYMKPGQVPVPPKPIPIPAPLPDHQVDPFRDDSVTRHNPYDSSADRSTAQPVVNRYRAAAGTQNVYRVQLADTQTNPWAGRAPEVRQIVTQGTSQPAGYLASTSMAGRAYARPVVQAGALMQPAAPVVTAANRHVNAHPSQVAGAAAVTSVPSGPQAPPMISATPSRRLGSTGEAQEVHNPLR